MLPRQLAGARHHPTVERVAHVHARPSGTFNGTRHVHSQALREGRRQRRQGHIFASPSCRQNALHCTEEAIDAVLVRQAPAAHSTRQKSEASVQEGGLGLLVE